MAKTELGKNLTKLIDSTERFIKAGQELKDALEKLKAKLPKEPEK